MGVSIDITDKQKTQQKLGIGKKPTKKFGGLGEGYVIDIPNSIGDPLHVIIKNSRLLEGTMGSIK